MADRLCVVCGTKLVRRPEERIGQWEIRVACSSLCAGKMARRRRETPAPKPCLVCGVLMVMSPGEGPRRFDLRNFCSNPCRATGRKLGIPHDPDRGRVRVRDDDDGLRLALLKTTKAKYPPGFRYPDITRAEWDARWKDG